jgi:hypothetical protein
VRFFAALILCNLGVIIFGIGIWSEYDLPAFWFVGGFILIVVGLYIWVEENKRIDQ